MISFCCLLKTFPLQTPIWGLLHTPSHSLCWFVHFYKTFIHFLYPAKTNKNTHLESYTAIDANAHCLVLVIQLLPVPLPGTQQSAVRLTANRINNIPFLVTLLTASTSYTLSPQEARSENPQTLINSFVIFSTHC